MKNFVWCIQVKAVSRAYITNQVYLCDYIIYSNMDVYVFMHIYICMYIYHDDDDQARGRPATMMFQTERWGAGVEYHFQEI